jgi:hypothetical protein
MSFLLIDSHIGGHFTVRCSDGTYTMVGPPGMTPDPVMPRCDSLARITFEPGPAVCSRSSHCAALPSRLLLVRSLPCLRTAATFILAVWLQGHDTQRQDCKVQQGWQCLCLEQRREVRRHNPMLPYSLAASSRLSCRYHQPLHLALSAPPPCRNELHLKDLCQTERKLSTDSQWKRLPIVVGWPLQDQYRKHRNWTVDTALSQTKVYRHLYLASQYVPRNMGKLLRFVALLFSYHHQCPACCLTVPCSGRLRHCGRCSDGVSLSPHPLHDFGCVCGCVRVGAGSGISMTDVYGSVG